MCTDGGSTGGCPPWLNKKKWGSKGGFPPWLNENVGGSSGGFPPWFPPRTAACATRGRAATAPTVRYEYSYDRSTPHCRAISAADIRPGGGTLQYSVVRVHCRRASPNPRHPTRGSHYPYCQSSVERRQCPSASFAGEYYKMGVPDGCRGVHMERRGRAISSAGHEYPT